MKKIIILTNYLYDFSNIFLKELRINNNEELFNYSKICYENVQF